MKHTHTHACVCRETESLRDRQECLEGQREREIWRGNERDQDRWRKANTQTRREGRKETKLEKQINSHK